MTVHLLIEPRYELSNNVVCATSEDSDKPTHTRCLIRAFLKVEKSVTLNVLGNLANGEL